MRPVFGLVDSRVTLDIHNHMIKGRVMKNGQKKETSLQKSEFELLKLSPL